MIWKRSEVKGKKYSCGPVTRQRDKEKYVKEKWLCYVTGREGMDNKKGEKNVVQTNAERRKRRKEKMCIP